MNVSICKLHEFACLSCPIKETSDYIYQMNQMTEKMLPIMIVYSDKYFKV